MQTSTTSKLRRGRPVDRTNEPALRRLEVWLAVETERRRHGKTLLLSVREATERLAETGGVNFVIAGEPNKIAKWNEQPKADGRQNKPFQIIRRSLAVFGKNRLALVNDLTGPICAGLVIRKATMIRARYNEAKALLDADNELKTFYEQILQTTLQA